MSISEALLTMTLVRESKSMTAAFAVFEELEVLIELPVSDSDVVDALASSPWEMMQKASS